LLLVAQSNAEASVSVRVDLDGLAVAGDGICILPQFPQRQAELVMGERELRIDVDGLAKGVHCLLRLLLVVEHAAQIVVWVAASPRRLEFDGLPEAGGG